MKTPLFLLSFLFLLSITSCELIDEAIPDVDTSYSETFFVDIGSNSGQSSKILVDITDSDEYNDFKENIKGFEITAVKYQVLNYNAPADMYFNGTITVISADDSETLTSGTVRNIPLSTIAGDGKEYDVTSEAPGIQKIEEWLDSPGSFYVMLQYNLVDSTGNPYPTEGKGYSFDLKIIYEVTVETGA